MSKKGSLKKITFEDDENSPMTYFIQYDNDLTHIMLSIVCDKKMEPSDYLLALESFVNDVRECPENLFVEDIEQESLH